MAELQWALLRHPSEFVHKMDAASLLCSRGLMASCICGFETGAALFFQYMNICYIINTLLYVFQTSQFSRAKCLEMFIASILFVIVYHKGLNHKLVAFLGWDWVIENNNFKQEREISDSLCSYGLFAFKISVQKVFTVVHLASPQGPYSGFENSAPQPESWSGW